MVTKGPHSRGVVALAMSLGASAVRGNQEDRVLAAAREMERLSLSGSGGSDGGEKEETGAALKKDHAHKIARELSKEQLAWLRGLPIILRVGHLPDASAAPWNASTLVVVHGGLVPGLPLEKQDAWAVMNMRSLIYPGKVYPKGGDDDDDEDRGGEEGESGDGKKVHEEDKNEGGNGEVYRVPVPISGRDGEPWRHAWNRYQNRLPASAAHTLAIYGHDAKAGLQVSPKVDISPWRRDSFSFTDLESEAESESGSPEVFDAVEDEEGQDEGEGNEESSTTQPNHKSKDEKKHKKKKKPKKKKRNRPPLRLRPRLWLRPRATAHGTGDRGRGARGGRTPDRAGRLLCFGCGG